MIDYCGDMPWADFPAVKTWYMKLEIPALFSGRLLADRWPGLTPRQGTMTISTSDTKPS